MFLFSDTMNCPSCVVCRKSSDWWLPKLRHCVRQAASIVASARSCSERRALTVQLTPGSMRLQLQLHRRRHYDIAQVYTYRWSFSYFLFLCRLLGINRFLAYRRIKWERLVVLPEQICDVLRLRWAPCRHQRQLHVVHQVPEERQCWEGWSHVSAFTQGLIYGAMMLEPKRWQNFTNRFWVPFTRRKQCVALWVLCGG